MLYDLRAAKTYLEKDSELYKTYLNYGFKDKTEHGMADKYTCVDSPDKQVLIEKISDLEIIAKDFDSQIIVDFEGKTIWVYNDYME